MLTQLIYLSDLVPGNEGALPSILETSVLNNQRDGLTGMLLYSGGNILQVLEGEPTQVHTTYERIRRDPRHRNLMVLTEESVPERQFQRWSMGFRHITPEDAQRLPKQAPYFQFGLRNPQLQAAPGVALEMLQLFSRDML